MKKSDYIANVVLYVIIAAWLWIFSFWIRLIFYFINKEDYETLIFFLALSGIAVIILGYWFKWYVYSCSIASPYTIESFQELRRRQKSKEKLTLNHKIDLWLLDGYSVKICNRVGFVLIAIAIVIFIYIR